jgi:signal transduction histidine kinase
VSTTTASLAAPPHAAGANPTFTSTWTMRILVVAAIASLPIMILSILDAGSLRLVWDNLHWSISATGAALAAAWSVRGASGRARAVRACATAALTLWAAGTVAWAWMNLTGTVTVPSVTDACIVAIVAIVVPGVGVLVASVRGRLSLAEEAAVYLDALLGFLLIGAILIYVFGPTAVNLPTAAAIAGLAYPAMFIGLGVSGLIAVLAVGYRVAPRGAFALLSGSALIGLAYLLWLAPTISLSDPGQISSMLFTIGTLVAAYGAATWCDERSISLRYLAVARYATRIVAPTVASVLFLLVLAPVPEAIAGDLHVAIFVASIAFIIRQALLLAERTRTLAALTRLTEENSRLVGELRGELERRALDERRMIQASRAAAVGDLAAGVAHEVNNPLTGVLGFTELLIDASASNDPRRADLETIRDEALRARDIVRALRDFANPRPPELAETDLAALVHQTVDLLRYSIERRGITIHEDLATLPPILVDGPAIQQAVLYILTIARQAVDDGGRLEIVVRAEGAGRLISITDDGVGMDATTAQLAFDPFFSGRDDADDVEPATGLGLSVSNGLIESHGGTISIQSRPGGGTTVEIRLPAGRPDLIGESRGGEAA